MAIYHCSISNVSRAEGSSSSGALAYISAKTVRDEYTGELFQYGRGERVVATGTIIPEYAPPEYADPKQLFNAIELYETAKNARTAKKIEAALPREFELDLQRQVVSEYIQTNLTEKGYACSFAIHNDSENNNPHCHILVVDRRIGEDGMWMPKRKKEYLLDEYGERVPRIDQETGMQKVDAHGRKQWERIDIEKNPLDKVEMIGELRRGWADVCNRYLAPEIQIDHRSYEDQGIERIPTIHEGYKARTIEKNGGVSDRCQINREIAEKNNLIDRVREQIQNLMSELAELFRQKEREQMKRKYDNTQQEYCEDVTRHVMKWIEETPLVDRLLKDKLPPFEEKEELAKMRENLSELNKNGWTPEYQRATEDPHFRKLVDIELRWKKITEAVNKGVSRNESFDQIVKRTKAVLYDSEVKEQRSAAVWEHNIERER